MFPTFESGSIRPVALDTTITPDGTTGITLAGVLVAPNATGIMAPATGKFNGVTMSEMISMSEANNRQYLFKDIDYGAWVRPAEPMSVANGFKGLLCTGFRVNTKGAKITKGKELSAVAGVLELVAVQGDGSGTVVAMADIPAGATHTGLILVND